MRQSDHLHAKVVLADRTRALVGSANLTRGGYSSNFEAITLLAEPEVRDLLPHVDWLSNQLSTVSSRDFYAFVEKCRETEPTREAVIDLITQESIGPEVPGPLTRLSDFIRALEASNLDFLKTEILKIYRNLDHNNRTGHLKQSFYAVQRFLREHPDRANAISQAPDEPFDVPVDLLGDWMMFLNAHLGEVDDALDYNFAILHHELPPRWGGTRQGGGGASYPFQLVWRPISMLIRGQL
jgi:hypothetical protein